MVIEQLERPRVADASTIIATSQQESAPTSLAKSFTIDRIALIGLQAALGYEWLVSGLDKIFYRLTQRAISLERMMQNTAAMRIAALATLGRYGFASSQATCGVAMSAPGQAPAASPARRAAALYLPLRRMRWTAAAKTPARRQAGRS